MLLSLPRKSTWTLHKVVPCVLQPWQQHSWSAEQLAARSREGQWGNTYLLRQHPCTPARDGIPTTNSCQHPCTPGQQRLTSECGVVSRGAINGDPSAFFAR
jgi:hypothetical protein